MPDTKWQRSRPRFRNFQTSFFFFFFTEARPYESAVSLFFLLSLKKQQLSFGRDCEAPSLGAPFEPPLETNDLSPKDKQLCPLRQVNITSYLQTDGSICKVPKPFTVVFENSTATCFVYTTVTFGQPADLSKEACLYVRTDLLNSSVSQRVTRGQFVEPCATAERLLVVRLQ